MWYTEHMPAEPTSAKPVRWTESEWAAVQAAAAKIGVTPTAFVKVFVLAGIQPDGLAAKLTKARSWLTRHRGRK